VAITLREITLKKRAEELQTREKNVDEAGMKIERYAEKLKLREKSLKKEAHMTYEDFRNRMSDFFEEYKEELKRL
jgi:hypothetical protein